VLNAGAVTARFGSASWSWPAAVKDARHYQRGNPELHHRRRHPHRRTERSSDRP
jgi:hypothetical protein